MQRRNTAPDSRREKKKVFHFTLAREKAALVRGSCHFVAKPGISGAAGVAVQKHQTPQKGRSFVPLEAGAEDAAAPATALGPEGGGAATGEDGAFSHSLQSSGSRSTKDPPHPPSPPTLLPPASPGQGQGTPRPAGTPLCHPAAISNGA